MEVNKPVEDFSLLQELATLYGQLDLAQEHKGGFIRDAREFTISRQLIFYDPTAGPLEVAEREIKPTNPPKTRHRSL